MLRTEYRLPVVALAWTLLVGCSEMKIVNSSASQPNEQDDKIVMTGVVADLTTSGMLQRRIHAGSGVYWEAAALLDVADVKVESYSTEGRKAGVTRATKGRSYFAPFEDRTTNPVVTRSKGDVEFTGDVRHDVPDKTDPTTNAVALISSHIWWNEPNQQYVSEKPYQMIIASKARRPLSLEGSGFRASADMSKWLVKSGSISTEQGKNPRAERDRITNDLAGVARRAREQEEASRKEREAKRAAMDARMTSAPVQTTGETGGIQSSSPAVAAMETPQVARTSTGRQVARLPGGGASRGTTSVQEKITTGGRKIARIPGPGPGGESPSVTGSR